MSVLYQMQYSAVVRGSQAAMEQALHVLEPEELADRVNQAFRQAEANTNAGEDDEFDDYDDLEDEIYNEFLMEAAAMFQQSAKNRWSPAESRPYSAWITPTEMTVTVYLKAC